ncbi:MAG: DUF4405 domain-containing protein [Halarcobacter sp.]
MSIKKITSLTMLLTMVIMTYTGIMLFIAPPGRVANWADWQIIGLSKEQYAQVHSTFMVLFIVFTLLHIYYNFKPMLSYMKNQAKQLVVFTKDMIISFLLVGIFLMGTLYNFSPFSDFLRMGDTIKNSWEKEYGTAPYSHAELDSLDKFSKKLGFDMIKVNEVLNSNNIEFLPSQSLIQISKNNKISPQFIYNILRKNLDKENKLIPLTGLGKKTVKEVAQTLNISFQEFKKQLNLLGIKNIEEDKKFKELLEEYDMSPMAVMQKLGYKKPN